MFRAGAPTILEAMARSSEMVLEIFNKKMLLYYTNISNTSNMPVATKRLQIKPWTLQKQRGTNGSYVALANFKNTLGTPKGKKVLQNFVTTLPLLFWCRLCRVVWFGVAPQPLGCFLHASNCKRWTCTKRTMEARASARFKSN